MTTTTAGQYPELMEAIRKIRSVCDGARTHDTQGFTVQHARLGKELAARSEWTFDHALEAYQMLATYQHTQLPGFGINYVTLLCPVRTDQDIAHRPMTKEERLVAFPAKQVAGTLVFDGKVFVVRFPYEPTLVDMVRSMKGRTWNDPNRGAWTVAPTYFNVAILTTILAPEPVLSSDGWKVDDAAVAELARVTADGPTEDDLPPTHNVELQRDSDGEPQLWIMRWDRDDPQFQERKAAVKAITGRRWDGKKFRWTAPVSATTARELVSTLETTGMTATDEVYQVAQVFEAKAETLRVASRLDDAEFQVTGLGEGMELLPFQRAGCSFGMAVPRFILGDEMGLGKTMQALALLQARQSFPALVVCPASVKLQWVDECERWLPGVSVDYLDSKGEGMTTQPDVLVVNYDLLTDVLVKDDEGERVKHPKTGKDVREPSVALAAVLDADWQALVVDELHYVKNPKAQRTIAIKRLVKGLPASAPVMMLSGTPIKNRPVELIEPLKILGVFDAVFGGWMNYVKRFCGAYRDNFGWKVNGSSNLGELADLLRGSCMIRRLKKEVAGELAEKIRVRTVVAMKNARQYRKAEADVIAYYADRKLQDEEFVESIQDMDPVEQHKAKQVRRKDVKHKALRAEALVRINALRELVGRLKTKAVIEWVENWLEISEGKLVLFAHHREVQKELAEAFGDQAISLTGGMSAVAKKAAVGTFQSDPGVRVFVASLGAGGTGVDGLQHVADTVAFVEYAWTPGEMSQAEDRIHRMGQDSDKVMVHHFVARDTIDTYFQEIITKKQAVLDAVLGDEGNEDAVAEARQANVFGAIEKALLSKAEV